MIGKYRLGILIVILGMASLACDRHLRLSAIDSAVTVSAAPQVDALLSAMGEGQVEAVFLSSGFEAAALDMETRNHRILSLAALHPARVFAVPTWRDDLPDLSLLSSWKDRGARAIGMAGAFFPQSDAAQSFYTALEAVHLPLLVYARNAKVDWPALSLFLSSHPEQPVLCLELCNGALNISGLRSLLTRFPNLYVSLGFAHSKPLEDGLLAFSRKAADWRELFLKFSDRILFSSFFGGESSGKEGLEKGYLDSVKGYRRLLQSAHYHFPAVSRRWDSKGLRLPADGALHGLFLPPEGLAKIYRENARRFFGLDAQPATSNTTGASASK